MSVLFKQGVIGSLLPSAQKGFGRVARLYKSRGVEMVVTSIREGNHGYGSLHYIGLAFDIRPHSKITVEDIREVLGEHWDVVEEGKGTNWHHIHCELDRK